MVKEFLINRSVPSSRSWPLGVEAPCDENGCVIKKRDNHYVAKGEQLDIAREGRRVDETEDLMYFADSVGRTARKGEVTLNGIVTGKGASGANSYTLRVSLDNPEGLCGRRLTYLKNFSVGHEDGEFDELPIVNQVLNGIKQLINRDYSGLPTRMSGSSLYVNHSPQRRYRELF